MAQVLSAARRAAGAAAALASEALLPRRAPRTRGRIVVDGGDAPVEILRDRWSVPHVFAHSAADALFGLGFAQASDRLWQMHWNRLAATGRISSVVGERGLPADRLTRTLGIGRTAEEAWRRTSEAERREVAPYLAGINAAIERSPRPFEARLLGAEIGPWRAEDSIAWSKLLSFLLGTAWEQQIARARIAAEFGLDALAEIDPPLPAHARTVVPPDGRLGGAGGALEAAAALRSALGIAGGASNNWAIAGRHAAAGAPIFACDPHLSPVTPPHAHFAHLHCPQFNAAGAGIPGMPGIIWGHNDRIAWGPTASMQAANIAVLEELSEDGASSRTEHGWKTVEQIDERIEVAGRDLVALRVRRTANGPIVSGEISDAVSPLDERPGERRAFALNSLVLRPRHSGNAILRLLAARDWDEFSAAICAVDDFNLCFGYADVDGRIGMRVSGAAQRGRPALLRFPAAGWLPPDQGGVPKGIIEPPEQPWTLDPPGGIAVSANNPLTPAGAAEFGAEYLDSARAQRIRDLLAETLAGGHSPADSARIQLDQVDLRLREFAEQARALAQHDRETAPLLDLLEGWDGDTAPDSAAAAVAACTAVEYRRAALHRILGGRPLPAAATAISALDIFSARAGSWALARISADQAHARSELSDALRAAARTLAGRLGPEPAAWRWGRCRALTLAHAFADVPLLGKWLSAGPFPAGGSADAINQSGVLGLDPFAPPSAAPALRLVVELSDPPRAQFALAGEQAGEPLRPAGPMTDAWLNGRLLPLLRDRAEIERAGSRRLVLEPPRADPSVD